MKKNILIILMTGIVLITNTYPQEKQESYNLGNSHFSIDAGYSRLDDKKDGWFFGGGSYWRIGNSFYIGARLSAHFYYWRSVVDGNFPLFHPVFSVAEINLKYAFSLTHFMSLEVGFGPSLTASTLTWVQIGYHPLVNLTFKSGVVIFGLNFKYNFLYNEYVATEIMRLGFQIGRIY